MENNPNPNPNPTTEVPPRTQILIEARTLVQVLALFHGVILSVHLWSTVANVTFILK